ncbi:MAG: MarR family transcriptional regulator [Nitrospirae bacterium]|nr:MarR family transcriptional regulator [Nitrospirota bacterium]
MEMVENSDLKGLEQEPFLTVLRPLAEAYLAFIRESDRHAEKMGLTGGQFDVIATLGDTDGMCCRELSEKTLVTKGTLTGVLDRLEKKGLIFGTVSSSDRRIRIIRLTEKGETLFREVFPKQLLHLKPFFQRALTVGEMSTLRELLLKVRDSFLQEAGALVERTQETGGVR